MGKTKNRPMKPDHSRKKFVTAVVANSAGEIFDLHGYAAAGMAGSSLVPLTLDDTIPMPSGGELMRMPDRKPVLTILEITGLKYWTKIHTPPENLSFRLLHLIHPVL